MSFVVRCVDGCTMCNQLTGDHVLTVEAGDVKARIAVAADCIHFNCIVQ